MADLDINDINLIWYKSSAEQARIKNRGSTVKCGYPYYDLNPSTGVVEKVQPDCAYGKGTWCKICRQHTNWRKQSLKNKKMVVSDKEKRLINIKRSAPLVVHTTYKGSQGKIRDQVMDELEARMRHEKRLNRFLRKEA